MQTEFLWMREKYLVQEELHRQMTITDLLCGLLYFSDPQQAWEHGLCSERKTAEIMLKNKKENAIIIISR